MKKIEALLPPARLNEVQSALRALGVNLMTCSEVREFGPQNRHREIYRSRELTVDFLPKVKIDLVVKEQQLEQTLKVIHWGNDQNKTAASKIVISDLNTPVEMRPI